MLARSSIVRAAALPPFLLLLALSLSVLTPTQAVASTTTSVPKTIAGALASPPARVLSMTPWGRGITLAVGLGLTAFETKDMWFPAVKEWMNPQQTDQASGDGWVTSNQYCGSEKPPEFLLNAPNAGGLFLDYKCKIANRSGTYVPGWTIESTADCKKTDTGVILRGVKNTSYPGIPSQQSLVYSANTTLEFTAQHIMPMNAICASGYVPVNIVIKTTQAAINSVATVFVAGLNGGTPDAQYQQTASIKCKKPDGTIVTTTESALGRPDRIYVPSCAEEFPGSIPHSGSITIGGRPGIDFVTNQDLITQWGQCFGAGGLLCKTEVYVDGQRCLMGTNVCMIWHDIWKAEPERVQCRFGPYDVPTTDCANLRYAYQRSHTITKTTQADPSLDPSANPDTPPKGSVEINPNPQPDPSPQPSPNPTPNPNPQPNPTAGPNPEAPPTTPTPETNPDSRSCYADAWSWNPVDWVYVPVKCALKWAFVPRPGFYETKINGLKTQFDSSTIGNYLGVVQGMVPAGASGCQGPEFRVGDTGSHYPMSACSGSPATLAASSRLILTIAISLGAGFACLRILGRSIGWDPAIGGDRA